MASEKEFKKEYNKLIQKYGHTHESALAHLNTDYSNGFEICKCGSTYHLGKGFTKTVVSKCPLCKPKDFGTRLCNPFVSAEKGVGKHGTGENRGLREAFATPERYYVSESGLHLRMSKLIKGT